MALVSPDGIDSFQMLEPEKSISLKDYLMYLKLYADSVGLYIHKDQLNLSNTFGDRAWIGELIVKNFPEFLELLRGTFAEHLAMQFAPKPRRFDSEEREAWAGRSLDKSDSFKQTMDNINSLYCAGQYFANVAENGLNRSPEEHQNQILDLMAGRNYWFEGIVVEKLGVATLEKLRNLVFAKYNVLPAAVE